MSKIVNFQGKPFHFIGIGGIGMSAIAYILAKRNLPVSGSDLRSSHITQRLESVGAHIFNHQDGANLEYFQQTPVAMEEVVTTGRTTEREMTNGHRSNGHRGNGKTYGGEASSLLTVLPEATHLPQVICSTAIKDNNSEYQAAKSKGCPVFHRSDVLAALIETYNSVAVAGTHGKTTTSSLIGYILLRAGLDPTIVVGGEVEAIGGNARLGESEYLVAEADESDGSLAKFNPSIGIITNIELDHPDHYQTLDEVIQTFQVFAEQCDTLVGCLDCEIVQRAFKPAISYSLDPEKKADYTATHVHYQNGTMTAQIWEGNRCLGELASQLLGAHNLSNSLAAIAVARHLGIEFETIAAAIASFEGAKRRFEKRGEAQGITFIDDYAHHPSELQATLKAAHLRIEEGLAQRLVAIFQPHRYSRTQAFLKDFAQSFQDADLVIITGIYSAGEPDLGQVSSQHLVDAIATHHQSTHQSTDSPSVLHCPNLAEMPAFLQEYLQTGDLVLFLGAGNLNQIIPQMLELYTTQATV
ncbi:UDP-N-acetylmuramate--L-alanine ligase [Spirulina sp. CS-785/01]|uniref:UDP-N-acetylmuramate--L-alanine ligase n=1 Tax=Spirulina sp. CS-785/01 TaxID=3021716 RepID=UPI00232FE12E|nr:UDP-N-acetylmuramate--L-alanine ligase [Spirulina sp. CS-785/01]MDB9313477.1 UDP-N-acetylmuramate--L-alanine ligase [Spirulina sp. CS-785/01]